MKNSYIEIAPLLAKAKSMSDLQSSCGYSFNSTLQMKLVFSSQKGGKLRRQKRWKYFYFRARQDSSLILYKLNNGYSFVSLQIVKELLRLPDIKVNALNREHKTALDIAESHTPSEDSSDIIEYLSRCGAVRANELNQPRDELRKTVTQIKNDVHTQLEQTKKTKRNVDGIAKELRKLHREGINNATNSVTVVAVLFATVAFAAIFTVPGGDNDDGTAVTVKRASFKIFFIFNAVALFTSLAVVVVQITLVRGETKAEQKVVEVINKLMWLASVCTTVSFIASSYIVVGRKSEWAAILVTVVGGVIMAGVLGTMTYYVFKSKRVRSIRRKKSARRSSSNSWYPSEFSDSEVDPFYAI